MHAVYLSLGANIGDTAAVIQKACEEIQKKPSESFRSSSLYQTSPVSDLSQRDFLNISVRFLTSLSPFELLDSLQAIERKLGKKPKPKNAPRIIDIDLLYYGNLVINQPPRLILPHPKVTERLFVLKPLSELTNELPNISDLSDYINHFENKNHEVVYEKT